MAWQMVDYISHRPSAIDRFLFIGDDFFGAARRASQDHAARRRSDELDDVLHFRARERAVLLDLLQRAGGVELRLEEIPEGALEFCDHVLREAAAHQSDRVGTIDTRRPAADRAGV